MTIGTVLGRWPVTFCTPRSSIGGCHLTILSSLYVQLYQLHIVRCVAVASRDFWQPLQLFVLGPRLYRRGVLGVPRRVQFYFT